MEEVVECGWAHTFAHRCRAADIEEEKRDWHLDPGHPLLAKLAEAICAQGWISGGSAYPAGPNTRPPSPPKGAAHSLHRGEDGTRRQFAATWFLSGAGSVDAIAAGLLLALAPGPGRTLMASSWRWLSSSLGRSSPVPAILRRDPGRSAAFISISSPPVLSSCRRRDRLAAQLFRAAAPRRDHPPGSQHHHDALGSTRLAAGKSTRMNSTTFRRLPRFGR